MASTFLSPVGPTQGSYSVLRRGSGYSSAPAVTDLDATDLPGHNIGVQDPDGLIYLGPQPHQINCDCSAEGDGHTPTGTNPETGVTITWPSTLPQRPLARDHGENFRDNVARTQMEVGPPKVRRRSTAGIQLIQATYLLTDTQVDILKTFYRTTTKDGSLSFNWPHPRTNTTAVVRFKEPPNVRHAQYKTYVAELQLEELP